MSYSNNFDFIKINLVSPERIKKWGQHQLKNGELIGEVISSVIDYKRLIPAIGGLFCERIFGPIEDWQCFCSSLLLFASPSTRLEEAWVAQMPMKKL